MALINPNEPELLNCQSIKVHTPDGTMFFNIIEDKDKPVGVTIILGKAGSSVQAWSQALAAVITLALRNNVEISIIAEEVSSITTDKVSFSNDRVIRSVPDAIAQAILIYLANKSNNPLVLRRRRRGPSVFGEEVG